WRTLDFPGEGADVGRGGGYKTSDDRTIPTIFPASVDSNGAVGLFKQDVKFFMPRVGIAYRPADKWVVRVGGGWFDNINHLNTQTVLNLMPPKSGSLQFDSVTDAFATRVAVTGADNAAYSVQTRIYRAGQPILTLNDPFLTQAGVTAAARPVNVTHAKPDTKDGDVWKWSLDIQRELPFHTAFTIG